MVQKIQGFSKNLLCNSVEMAHPRLRYLTPVLKKAMNPSPLVGILGHRQVGKTTILQQMVRRYCTLDAPTTTDQAKQSSQVRAVFTNRFRAFYKSQDHSRIIDRQNYELRVVAIHCFGNQQRPVA